MNRPIPCENCNICNTSVTVSSQEPCCADLLENCMNVFAKRSFNGADYADYGLQLRDFAPFYRQIIKFRINLLSPRVIWGFCRKVDENCTLLRCYATCSDNSLPRFRDVLEGETNRLPRNVGEELHYTLRNSPEERSARPPPSSEYSTPMMEVASPPKTFSRTI